MASNSEYNAFMQWYNKLPLLSKPFDWFKFGDYTGDNFKTSRAYDKWRESGGGVGVASGTEEKAAQYAAFKTAYPKATQADWIAYRDKGTVPGATGVGAGGGLGGLDKGRFVGLEEHMGYL